MNIIIDLLTLFVISVNSNISFLVLLSIIVLYFFSLFEKLISLNIE